MEKHQICKKEKGIKRGYSDKTMNEIVLSFVLKLEIIATILLVLIYVVFKSYNIISSEIATMNETLLETKTGIQVHEEIQEETQNLFVDAYINRVNNISAILKLHKNKVITSDELKELADFENVSNIYIVNNEGIIIQSSDKNSIGIDFYKNSELATFISLIESKENGYYCDFSKKSIMTGNSMVYLMVRNEPDKLVQIEIELSALQEYINGTSISAYIEGIPTKWEKTILTMDSYTGEVLAITKNNEQTIEGENLLEKFKKAQNAPKIVTVNKKWQLVISEQVSDDILLVEFISFFNMIYGVLIDSAVFAFCVLLLNIFIYYVLVKVLKKYVLQDIMNMNEDIQVFMSGKDIEIRDASTKELSELSKQLIRLKEGIHNSKEQMKLTLSLLGKDFTGYEYYPEYNRLQYADNCLELTGWTESELEKEVKFFFEQNKSKFGESKNVSTLVRVGNERIFKLNRYITHDFVYAIAEDITDKENLKKQLLYSQEESYLDSLTKLYNRRKLESMIQDMNREHEVSKGVMILLDLDNFKKINDEKGHVEGDIVLMKFSDLLRKNFIESDLKVRFGGDEFIILIPYDISEDILIKKIEQFLEDMRVAFHQYHERFQLSVSIGCVYISPKCRKFEDLYYYADVAMYTAKKNGKNGYYIIKDDES